MEENNSTMSDYIMINNYRESKKMLSELEVHMTNYRHSVRFTRGEINDDLLNSVVGKTWDLDDTGVTFKNSFEYGDKVIFALETFSEDRCYINEYQSKFIEQVNVEGSKIQRFSVSSTNDMCVADNGDVYFTDYRNKSISCLSPSGSVSTVGSTGPLTPIGICQSVDGGLMVTLRDKESDRYKLQSHSRRLVRHTTVTGDVIYEYEYKEDGQTRLFTRPTRLTQNSNSDICVANHKSHSTGEIVIMSPSGHVKSVYRGQNLTEDFRLIDVVCDSLCNILVTDRNNKQIHLLCHDGDFLKFLLTENEVNHPSRSSLYKWWDSLKDLSKCFKIDDKTYEVHKY
ncbi:uncharacterized protein LOC134283799 [Saccostrea cucullata]|uniref:uncharacterized protein LOC134283799 n=1 Tax=Saccostrea cuccullata TaxID=36930 RepID=UPI002ECFB604